MSDPREFTNLILDNIEAGELHAAPLLKELLNYLSEGDVQKFYVDADISVATLI